MECRNGSIQDSVLTLENHGLLIQILLALLILENPEDTDVFKTSSGRLKKVTTHCDQTRRRHNLWRKTSDLRRLEDVQLAMSFQTSDLRHLEDV